MKLTIINPHQGAEEAELLTFKGYAVFESKINSRSLEELEQLIPQTANVVINHLKNLRPDLKSSHSEALEDIAKDLIKHRREKPIDAFNLPRGVYYDISQGYYKAKVTIDGKPKVIKSSTNLDTIVTYLLDYCAKHKIIGYG